MGSPQIGQRIEYRRKQLGLTLDDIATDIGVARSTVQRYEKGAIEKIKLPVIEAIARVLDVSPTWLCCKSDDMRPSGPNKSSLPSNALPYNEPHMAPIVGAIPAGYPALAFEEVEGYASIPYADTENYFFLRVSGESMINAGIKSGDLVLLRKQDCADDGQIVAARVNGDEATLKRFKRQGDMVLLLPENPAYDPRVVPAIDFETGEAGIIGVAVEVRHTL